VSAVVDEKFQNAPGDEYAKEATSAIREPDFFEPGTLFPCTITLRDATPEEVSFALGITLKNKRYGATTTRLGRVNNHVLDIYVGNEEGPANLELSRELVRRFANEYGGLEETVFASSLSRQRAREYTLNAYEAICKSSNLSVSSIGDEAKEALRSAATEDLESVLEDQSERSEEFIKRAG